MKTQLNSILKIAAFSIALFSWNKFKAQADTVKVYERTVVHDTVVKENPKTIEMPPLKKGEFGIRYLPTFSSLALRTYGGEVVQGDVTMSHGFGLMFAHNFNDYVGLQTEVNYYQVSQKFRDASLDRTVSLSYLNIPLLLSLNTNKRKAVNWNFVAGPQFGLNLGSSIKTSGNSNSETIQATVAAKEGDVGVAYGTGLEFMLNRSHNARIDLGYRGFYGFVDMNASQTSPNTYNILVKGTRKTQGAYLGLTFLF